MRSFSRIRVLLGLALAVAPFVGAIAPGCGSTTNFVCADVWDPDRIGPDGLPDPCCAVSDPCLPPGASHDAGAKDAATDDAAADDGGPPQTDAATDADADASPPWCPWTCLDLPSSDWFGPVLFWKGDVGDGIVCPAAAPVLDYSGFADLLDTGQASCGACGCVASTGACAPPEHLIASTAKCSGSGGDLTAFDPPPGWDGTCSSFDHLGPGPLSLTSGPLMVVDDCEPGAAPSSIPTTPAGFGAAVVACRGATSTCDQGHICAPTDPAFQSCIWQPADVPTCPDTYPLRIPVAGGFDDQRTCTPCACGAVEGSVCTGTLSLYADLTCGGQFAANGLDSASAPCWDVIPAGMVALGSKTLTAVKYKSGTCAPSGGEPTGGVIPTGVATFCCLP